jgi:hypothetical protein
MERIVLLLLVLVTLGCEEKMADPYLYTELAMSPEMQIIAANMNGQVSIEWLSPLSRKYKWDNHEEIRTLIPRKTRFMRKLGAYDPATQSIFCFFCPIRIVADDSMLDFNTMEEVYEYLYQGSAVLDWVYNDNGWVVGFAKVPERKQVNIHVYKITVNGKSPLQIKGSRNDAIEIIYN